jgi:hypothetical protein
MAAAIVKAIAKSKPGKKLMSRGLQGLGLLRGTAGLALPVIGGAMGLIGGAMGLAGGVLNAGSTLTGIAADAAGGVLGAVGGLAGGGQSGNVSKDSQIALYKPTSKKSSNSKGLSLANIKSPLSTSTGAMSMLSQGDESPMSMLSGMLNVIAVNTSYLGSIDAKMDALISVMSRPLIDRAKDTKGDDENDPKQSAVKKTFSALGDKLKSLSGGLASGAKSILKGVALAGLFILFQKYREQIVGMVSSLFETLEGWYTALTSGGNPITDMFENVKTYFDTTVLPMLKEMTISFLKMLFNTIRTVANSILPEKYQIPDIFVESDSGSIPQKYDSVADTRLSSFASKYGGSENLGRLNAGGGQYIMGTGMNVEDSPGIQMAIKDRLKQMYAYFEASGGRIQWSNIGKGFELGGGIESIDTTGGITIAKIMSSLPIVDGYDRTIADLENPNLLATPFGDVESTFRTEFLKNLVQMSDAKQMSNIGTSQRMMRLTTNPLEFFENFGADAGKELNQLESQSRAILSAAGAYDAQSIMIGGEQETNISANQDVIQGSASVLSTDTNLQYHFGSAISQ